MKPRIREADITRSIRDYLNIKKIFHWKNWSGPMSVKGIPDIIAILPGGKSLLIEVKTPEGKLSDHQRQFLENAEHQGAVTIVARGISDLQARGV